MDATEEKGKRAASATVEHEVTSVCDQAVEVVDALKSDEVTNSSAKPAPTQQRNAWGVPGADTKSNDTDATAATNKDATSLQSKPLSFASIMEQQITESKERKAENTRSTRVKFCAEVESEEERQMRLAIEASLRDQQHDYFHLEPHAQKSALKNCDLKSAENHVSFPTTNTTIAPIDDDMDEDMKMAIALSLQDAGGSSVHFYDGDKKPSALDFNDDEKMPPLLESDTDEVVTTDDTAAVASFPVKYAPPVAAFASAAASANPETSEDESEKLARALYDAELAEFNTNQSASAASEEASLKLAMMLQQEEDDRLRNNLGQGQYSKAARVKREEMCRGGSRGGAGDIGVRTVGREEFHKMKNGGNTHFDGTAVERRKAEEKGMGRFLKSSGQFDESDDLPVFDSEYSVGDNNDYDVYEYEEYEEEGIRMNPQSGASPSWKRLDKNTFVGNDNEVRSKHDPELAKSANATKLKDAYSIGSSVSDSTYNSFKRAEARQTGMKKGVAKQGHGRAENMNAAKTRGGAMDGNVRLQISAAINQGLIERCNGVVKEGKEALVYHAEGVQDPPTELSSHPDFVRSDGYDVAVKVFKRISEFKGRGMYVDGDPRFHKQKFKSNDQREQIVVWTEKEYRNLIRAHRGGVKVPVPLRQKENVLFMRFLGENGWPSPQLREIEIKKGSERWTVLYCQTIAAIRRLYHCSRLVHADLSEYNILLCPSWQLSKVPIRPEQERTGEDLSLVIVLIDFGQAVEREHPNAKELLMRDIRTVRDFFVKQGIQTLPVVDAEEFILAPFSGNEDAKDNNDPEPNDENDSTWRHNIRGWDDEKVIEDLLAKLQVHETANVA